MQIDGLPLHDGKHTREFCDPIGQDVDVGRGVVDYPLACHMLEDERRPIQDAHPLSRSTRPLAHGTFRMITAVDLIIAQRMTENIIPEGGYIAVGHGGPSVEAPNGGANTLIEGACFIQVQVAGVLHARVLCDTSICLLPTQRCIPAIRDFWQRRPPSRST